MPGECESSWKRLRESFSVAAVDSHQLVSGDLGCLCCGLIVFTFDELA